MSRNIPRTPEGRVLLVANGGTINGTYRLPVGEALEAFRADLKELAGRPTMDSYLATCRALHWRHGQLRANGIEPITLTAEDTYEPPVGTDFLARQAEELLTRSRKAAA